MPELFSELTCHILDLAHVEAIRLDHARVTPAHLLLALLREQTNRPGELLRRLGVSVDAVRRQLKEIEGDAHSEVHCYPIPRSPGLEWAITSAIEAARRSDPPVPVQPEHLLSGLVRDNREPIVQILRNLGVDADNLFEDFRVAFLKRRPSSSSLPATVVDAIVRKDPLERFSKQARKVMQLAGEEALRLHHDHVGTEHLLLGIVSHDRGIAAHVLRLLGIHLKSTRVEVEKLAEATPPHEARPDKLLYTLRVKEVIDFAIEESHKLEHDRIEPEHLLLGLLRMESGGARRVIENLGLSPEHVRAEVLGQFRELG
jgi:ATP-dependent Clp protease ATP-binding subunit ClpA